MILKDIWRLVKDSGSSWLEDKAPRLGAALAYYTVFSIAPLLIIVAAVAGFVFGPEAAEGRIVRELESLVGSKSAMMIQSVIEQFNRPRQGLLATAIGLVTILVGATGLFSQLQDALNTIWQVKRPSGRGILATLKDYFASFAMVVVIGFLLLVSLLLSVALSAISEFMGEYLPVPESVLRITNVILSFGVTTLLFAMIYKILPDAVIRWNDVWIGAGVTALLFTLGKMLIGLYIGRSVVTSAYGAAGSLVVVLIWVYYSAQIVLLGAEFTQVYAHRYGQPLIPRRGAVLVTEKDRIEQGLAPQKRVTQEQNA